ncbi:unnamed protein product [Lactuca virosa]|uniref:Uncharacterized protein n=1 Tax=Lactuca virosa TaxID=75947 RepID=A0AAU9M4S9_9ASTR|nr:unnamed protein product [Lactuca virosa]
MHDDARRRIRIRLQYRKPLSATDSPLAHNSPAHRLPPLVQNLMDAMSVAIRSMLFVVAAIPLYLWLRREVSQSDGEEPQAGKSNGRRNYGYR